YICSRKIGSQRFLPRKKASALRLCRIFFGSKIASANFSAALRKLEIGPNIYKFFLQKKAPLAVEAFAPVCQRGFLLAKLCRECYYTNP
ncbi:MAG: hypothetical protein II579_01385, partial [Treponema sp.]|nr:hypothetical protein [Treponema sp.]